MRETDFKTKKSANEKEVIEFYNEYAVDWDSRFGDSHSSTHFIDRRWKSFESAIEVCDANMKIGLELGVGTGVYLDRCSKLFESILAVDGSVRMVEVLRDKVEKLKIPNVTTMVSDVLALHSVPDSSVDCVYFFGLLEHIIDTDLFVLEIKRVLKTNGYVVGVTPNGSSPWYKIRRFIRGTGKHCSSDTYYTLEQISNMFEQKGYLKVYGEHWGLVPAGINAVFGRFLCAFEPFFEKTLMKFWMGGITFAYKINKLG